jgi:hypothetical protein
MESHRSCGDYVFFACLIAPSTDAERLDETASVGKRHDRGFCVDDLNHNRQVER